MRNRVYLVDVLAEAIMVEGIGEEEAATRQSSHGEQSGNPGDIALTASETKRTEESAILKSTCRVFQRGHPSPLGACNHKRGQTSVFKL